MNEDELAERLERQPSGASPSAPEDTAATTAARIGRVLSDESTWLEPAAGGADALMAAIRAESEPGDATPAPSTPAATSRRPRRYVALSLAAALLLLAGIAGGLLLGGGDDRRPDREPIDEFAMTGTDLAPDASAAASVIEWRSGLAIRLEISGLPPAEPGTYYEGWVRGPDGRVSIGTFHMQGGDGPVELWSGVDLHRYPTYTVTIQEEGSGPEPSGQVVLSGEVGGGSRGGGD